MEYFKILVVHRQEGVLEEVRTTFEKFGPCLRQYNCGIDGLQAAKLEHFDLILCGTDLPLISGFEMVRAIRNLSRNCFTPVILISTTVVAEQASLCRQLGCLGIAGSGNLEANLSFMIENANALRFLKPSLTPRL